MSGLIERYIYDVTRRLPEKERGEVSKELQANIYDMLADGAGDTTDGGYGKDAEDDGAADGAVRAVLQQLGPPAALAEKYRQNPQYLISPAIYDEYLRTLKLVLPLVGVAVLVAGMIMGALDNLGYGLADISYIIAKSLAKGLALAISAVIQALMWTTIGFVIAERTGAKPEKNKKWRIEDLPPLPAEDKARIPLSDSIAELVMTLIFGIIVILLCSGVLPFSFVIINGETRLYSLFSPGFLASCVPAIIIVIALSIIDCLVKIKAGRWTALVCGTTVASSLISTFIVVYLINRPGLFSDEFLAFIRGLDGENPALMGFLEAGGGRAIILLITAVIVIVTIGECCYALYRTLRSRRQQA